MTLKEALNSLLTAGVFAIGLASALPAHASVVIAGTRVIYNEGEVEQTIKLTNNGQSPSLTQIWLDKGDPNARPSAIEVPFTVSPPFARIDPNKGQTLRILYTGEPLPQDRESVFWLNVLEVPPKPAAGDNNANLLQMAFRSRIKLFFRPSGLKGNADAAPAQVSWRVIESGEQVSLEGRNPTPYHVSFASMKLVGGGKTASFEAGGMINPGEALKFPLHGDVTHSGDARVLYRAINDYGGPVDGEAPLNRSPAN